MLNASRTFKRNIQFKIQYLCLHKDNKIEQLLTVHETITLPKKLIIMCQECSITSDTNIVFFSTSVAHPSSDMPSRNSFLLNSHCVAALNFHATTSMLMLAGSRVRSSQNCWIPSMPILLSSCGSANTAESQQNSAEVWQASYAHVNINF